MVAEGVLTKACRKKPKQRMFFLFNDLLVYGNIVISNMKYNLQNVIPLEEIKLEDLENDDECLRNGWLICSRGKSFAVYSATKEEKEEWMENINKVNFDISYFKIGLRDFQCIKNLLKKSGRKAAENHAAVLVPLSMANTCMICKKEEFTLVNRPYHCRKCGKICCHSCSSKRVLLPSQPGKPLRVCTACFQGLQEKKPWGKMEKIKGKLVSPPRTHSFLLNIY